MFMVILLSYYDILLRIDDSHGQNIFDYIETIN